MRRQNTGSNEFSAFCDYRDEIIRELPSDSNVLSRKLLVTESELDAALSKLPEYERLGWQKRFVTGYSKVANSQREQLASALRGDELSTDLRKAA